MSTELLVTTIIGIIQIILQALSLMIHNSIQALLCLSMLISSLFIFLSIIFIRRYKAVKYKYELTQYLFHNAGRHQFNVLPKEILLIDKESKINNVEINNISITWDMYRHHDWIDSDIVWDITDITNISKHNIYEYSIYNTYDLGKDSTLTNTWYINGIERKRSDRYTESNHIRRINYNLFKKIRPKEKLKNIKINIHSKNSVKIGRTDILSIYPYNYGLKVKSLSIKINMNFTNDIFNLDCYQIGTIKNKTGINEENIGGGIEHISGTSATYNYEINDVNMSNVYCILLTPIH